MQRLDDKSRMSGDVHVRFCERLEGRFLRATRLVCAFELEADAQRFYSVFGNRLGEFGLAVAAEKTNLIRFSPIKKKRVVPLNSWDLSFVGDLAAGASR